MAGTHHHDHHHHSIVLDLDDQNANRKNQRRIALVLVITFGFMLVELLGGYLSNSLALISDAIHMLTDSAALVISWVSIYLAGRPPDSFSTFGLQRAEPLAGLINSVLLLVLAISILFHAFERYSSPPEVNSQILIWVALAGLLVNIVAAFILSKGQSDNMALKAAFMHVLGDALSSVGAIVAGVLIFWKQWYIADVLISIFVAIIISYSAIQLFRKTGRIVLQAVPEGIDINAIAKRLLEYPEVIRLHDLHLWSLNSGKAILTVHVVSESQNRAEILGRIKDMLKDEFGILHSTIQLETAEFEQSEKPS